MELLKIVLNRDIEREREEANSFNAMMDWGKQA